MKITAIVDIMSILVTEFNETMLTDFLRNKLFEARKEAIQCRYGDDISNVVIEDVTYDLKGIMFKESDHNGEDERQYIQFRVWGTAHPF